MFWKTVTLCASALGLGLCLSGPILAQTTLSDGAGNVITTGGGKTVLRDGAGNRVLTHSARAPHTAYRAHRRSMGHRRGVSLSGRNQSGNARMTTSGIRAHQSDGQYGTLRKGSITGRDRNGEKGSISVHGIRGL